MIPRRPPPPIWGRQKFRLIPQTLDRVSAAAVEPLTCRLLLAEWRKLARCMHCASLRSSDLRHGCNISRLGIMLALLSTVSQCGERRRK